MTTLSESRFEYLTHPERVQYTSDILNNAYLNHPHINVNYYKTQQQRKYGRLPYYDSPVKNSHQYPLIKGDFENAPYIQQPVSSQLYKNIANTEFVIGDKIIKRKDLPKPRLYFE